LPSFFIFLKNLNKESSCTENLSVQEDFLMYFDVIMDRISLTQQECIDTIMEGDHYV